MSVDALVRALDGLQHDAMHRNEYNEWLQRWQRSPDAWQVSYDVLADSDADRALKIFCAQTLRHKIAYDLHQAPRGSRLALKDQVLDLMEQNLQLVAVVGVQLCVALAAFAMQVPEWENPLVELASRFDAPEFVPLLFEFLRVLPEEFSSNRLTLLLDAEQRRDRAEDLVQNNAPMVLRFLAERAEYMANTNRALFFETLNPWLREVEVASVVQSPLLEWISNAMNDDDAREAASDCLCTLIHETDDVREPLVQKSVELLFPCIMALRPLLTQAANEPELYRDVTRVVAQAAEDWHVLCCTNYSEFSPLVELLADCIEVPDADLEVIEYTFTFFDRIRLVLDAPAYEEVRKSYSPLFLRLISAFTSFLQFPTQFSNLEEEDKFRDFRYDIGDMLKVCSFVAGPDNALKHCQLQLERLISAKSSWEPIEAILFCVRALARTVPEDSSALASILALFPSLPAQERIIHAALLIMGRYSRWAAHKPEIIVFELEYMTSNVHSQWFECRRAAAHSLMFFCNDCAEILTPYIPKFIEFYKTLSGSAELESLCKISDGLGAIVAALPANEQLPVLQQFVDPVIRRIEESPVDLDSAANDLMGIGSFLALQRGDPLSEIVRSHNTTMTGLITTYGPTHALLTEAVVRYYTQACRNAPKAVYQVLGTLLQPIAILAGEKPWLFFWEFGGALAQAFPEDPLIWEFDHLLVGQLLLHLAKQADPELIEVGFHFLCDMVTNFAPQFLPSPDLPKAVEMAAAVLATADDSQALIAVGHYFEDLATYCPYSGQSPYSVYLEQAFTAQGLIILQGIFDGLLRRFDENVWGRMESILNLIFRTCLASTMGWVQQVLAALPEDSVSDEERFEFSQHLFNELASQRFNNVGRVINDFVQAYSERNYAPR